MDANRPIVKLKLDVIFKRVFGDENNTDIIARYYPLCSKYRAKALRELL